ncbi:unnamed protein product [Vitrella brassicaformis CCMP3155]|uniref:Uncharacterized protein n=1 Tax=Vitrella brassicaformis (strain CCMP3155) TaxID=1169540 RepID=A0A0G4GPW9_VITBC|nr:unnamed protein product [Vitrella brassicaformis CCMP3155]|eukprot:CEM32408.1 unnamed protein product [Vitrella brassicaformis CCMP3155]
MEILRAKKVHLLGFTLMFAAWRSRNTSSMCPQCSSKRPIGMRAHCFCVCPSIENAVLCRSSGCTSTCQKPDVASSVPAIIDTEAPRAIFLPHHHNGGIVLRIRRLDDA